MLAFFALTSARTCERKDGCVLFNSQSPEAGSCQENGLGWKGRSRDFYPEKDQFFTKWTDLFLRPECIDRIEVYTKYPEIEELRRNIKNKDLFCILVIHQYDFVNSAFT